MRLHRGHEPGEPVRDVWDERKKKIHPNSRRRLRGNFSLDDSRRALPAASAIFAGIVLVKATLGCAFGSVGRGACGCEVGSTAKTSL